MWMLGLGLMLLVIVSFTVKPSWKQTNNSKS
jgi:hypothetical protein